MSVNVAMDNSVMHLEIVCDSTQILVHQTILEITHERQDALVGVSVLLALKEPSHHDVLASVCLTFKKLHQKMQNVRICSDLQTSTCQSVCRLLRFVNDCNKEDYYYYYYYY